MQGVVHGASSSSGLDPGASYALSSQQVLLWRILDEIDYGVILVDRRARILHANHLARHELARGHTIRSVDQHLRVVRAEQSRALDEALQLSGRGRRILIELRGTGGPLALAFVPMSHRMDARDLGPVLVLCGKQTTCEDLTLGFFARAKGLTAAEESVLRALCHGDSTDQIAERNGVSLSTIRSQILSLRAKTEAGSIRALIRQVAALPPMIPELRMALCEG